MLSEIFMRLLVNNNILPLHNWVFPLLITRHFTENDINYPSFMGWETEAQTSNVAWKVTDRGWAGNKQACFCMVSRQETTLGRAVDLKSAEIYIGLSASCMSWNKAIYLFYEASFCSSAFFIWIRKVTSPMNHTLLEMKMRFTWPAESAVSTRRCFPSMGALLSRRQLLGKKDQRLPSECSWEKHRRVFPLSRTALIEGVCGKTQNHFSLKGNEGVLMRRKNWQLCPAHLHTSSTTEKSKYQDFIMLWPMHVLYKSVHWRLGCYYFFLPLLVYHSMPKKEIEQGSTCRMGCGTFA